MSEIWTGVIITVVGGLVVALIIGLFKPARQLWSKFIKTIRSVIFFPFVVWKKINQLEKKQVEHGKQIEVLLAFIMFSIPGYSSESKDPIVFLLKIADLSCEYAEEATIKEMLLLTINSLKKNTPPLKITPKEDIDMHESLEVIKKQSKFFIDEVEEIERLLKAKKFAP